MLNEGVGDGTLLGRDRGVITESPLCRSAGGTCTRGEDLVCAYSRWIFGLKGCYGGVT